MEWTWTASAWGYEVFFNGRPVGGAGTKQTGGRRVSRRMLKDNAYVYRVQAEELAAECRRLHAHLSFDPEKYQEAGIWAWLPAARLAALRSQHEVLNGIA